MLTPISQSEIKRTASELLDFLEPLDRNKRFCLALTLLDGTSVCGEVEFGVSSSIEPAEIVAEEPPLVVEQPQLRLLSLLEPGIELNLGLEGYIIPYSIIAGICPFILLTSGNHDSITYPFGDDLRRMAKLHDFIENDAEGIIGVGESPVFGNISVGYDTALYCDWGALSRKEGGLRSLGASTPWGGLSAGFSPSLWSAFHKVIKKDAVTLEGLCDVSEQAAILGFPQILDLSQMSPELQAKWVLESEGSDWIPIVIADKSGSAWRASRWQLAYLRRDCAMLPLSLWEKFTTPTRFFGDVTHEFVETELGRVRCYLKLRAAAHLAKDEA